MADKLEVAKKALLAGSYHIRALFGKTMAEIGGEYKPKDGDTPRTLIDMHAEAAILEVIRSEPEFKDDLINAEESGESGSGKRVWHVDPYDGTSNAQIKLPMSTMGIGIAEDGELVASVILNPFEEKLFYAGKRLGAFALTLVPTRDQHGLTIKPNSKVLLTTDQVSNSAKERFAWIDPMFNSKTTKRKLEWIAKMQEAGFFQNARMTGSNIDYSAKVAEGRGHYQLTDAVGGYYDLCGCVLIEEAGGRMVNIRGERPKPGDQVAIAVANQRDLDAILKITEACYKDYKGFR